MARFGTLDGLVNNAARGMQQISAEVTNAKPFHEVGVEAWRAMVEVNLAEPRDGRGRVLGAEHAHQEQASKSPSRLSARSAPAKAPAP